MNEEDVYDVTIIEAALLACMQLFMQGCVI